MDADNPPPSPSTQIERILPIGALNPEQMHWRRNDRVLPLLPNKLVHDLMVNGEYAHTWMATDTRTGRIDIYRWDGMPKALAMGLTSYDEVTDVLTAMAVIDRFEKAYG